MSSVNLKMDPVTGRSRGFAFIVFATEEVLTALLEQEHAIKGKKVAVKKAASKQARMNLYPQQGGPPYKMSLDNDDQAVEKRTSEPFMYR